MDTLIKLKRLYITLKKTSKKLKLKIFFFLSEWNWIGNPKNCEFPVEIEEYSGGRELVCNP